MKKLTIEYQGYKLEIETTLINPSCYPIVKETCEALSFIKKNTYREYQPIIDGFMKAVDREYEEEARNETLAVLD